MFPIIPIIVTLVVVGLCLYLISLIPMDAAIHNIIRVVVIICVVLWLLSLFLGGAAYYPHYR